MTRIKNFAITLLATILVSAATTAHAQFSTVYSFGATGAADANNPNGAIAQGEDGALYSTAIPSPGGTPIDGELYKVTPAGQERVLYSFCSPNCASGNAPFGGLTLQPDGHFPGATASNVGFVSPSYGSIFDISQTGSFSTIYTFTGGADGGVPFSNPIGGPDGAFYGVTSSEGGADNCGTVYRLSATFAVIHTFNKVDGCNPYGALVLGTDGSFYGTTSFGGTKNYGVVFKLTYRPGQSTLFAILANFDSTTGSPVGALVEGNDGNFYGVTNANYYNESGVTDQFGAIYKVAPSGGLTVVHALNGSPDGAYPADGLTLATDGNLYGTAQSGGTGGTLFQFTPAGVFSVLHNFGGSGGFNPTNIVQHTNGLLYGVTTYGGPSNGFCYACGCAYNDGCGVVYSWNGSLPQFVSAVQLMGAVGSTVEILGQGFTSSTTVSFNGTSASAMVQSGTSLWATVPAGATSGFIAVTTSSGTLTSNRQFIVTP